MDSVFEKKKAEEEKENRQVNSRAASEADSHRHATGEEGMRRERTTAVGGVDLVERCFC